MKQAISYSRYSSGAQSHGSSIERQQEMFRQWLAKNSDEYQESDIQVEDRGKSAYKAKHLDAGLGSIMLFIQNGRIRKGDCLVIEAFDRLSRESTTTALNRITEILGAGITIVTLEDNAIYTEKSLNTTAVYVLVSKIQASYEYSKRLALRVKAGWKNNENKIRNGVFAKVPNRPSWIDSNFKIKEQERDMVLLAVDEYLSGKGIRSIYITLRAAYPDIAPAADRTITRWLRNENLIGNWRGEKAFSPLISNEKYIQLQELLRKRSTFGKPPTKYPLSGLLKCGECKGAINFRRQLPRETINAPKGSLNYEKKGYIIYGNCASYLKGAGCDNSYTIPYEVADFIFNQTAFAAAGSVAEIRASKIYNANIYGNLSANLDIQRIEIKKYADLYELLGESRYLERLSFHKKKADEISRKIEAVRSAEKSLYPAEDDSEFISLVQHQYQSVTDDLFKLRDDLKILGYCIYVKKEIIWASGMREKGFKILKRSQKLGGYLVESIEENLIFLVQRVNEIESKFEALDTQLSINKPN
ncbi:recombinase family protein [Comamonas odontotermitis]|uniref:recombinase family protein n=1 Tax=Comamonas odontotermitis TaxID=379895 RepID=UPI003672A5EC